jgi:hypothetical protein
LLTNCRRARPDSTPKIAYLHARMVTIENGIAFLPDEVPWLA